MKPQANISQSVYQVWFETAVGPTFSSKALAESWLDKEYENNDLPWKERGELFGYPCIILLNINDAEAELMDR